MQKRGFEQNTEGEVNKYCGYNRNERKLYKKSEWLFDGV